MLIAAAVLLASPGLWAWNPYDTDSGWSSADSMTSRSAPGDYRTPQRPRWEQVEPSHERSDWPGSLDSRSQWYLPEEQRNAPWASTMGDVFDPGAHQPVDGGWRAGSQAADWGDRGRWQRTPSEAHRGPHESRQDSYWADSGSDDLRRDQRRYRWPGDSGRDWDSAPQRRSTSAGDYIRSDVGRYQFRYDPELSARRPGHQSGWEFRPLSEREHERSLADSPYPEIDERDYLPRGPWRSYQDEGAAFGYHADDQWPSYSPQPQLR